MNTKRRSRNVHECACHEANNARKKTTCLKTSEKKQQRPRFWGSKEKKARGDPWESPHPRHTLKPALSTATRFRSEAPRGQPWPTAGTLQEGNRRIRHEHSSIHGAGPLQARRSIAINAQAGVAMLHHSLYSLGKLRAQHRLRQHALHPGLQALIMEHRGAVRGHPNDRYNLRAPMQPNLPRQLQPAHLRHVHVRQHNNLSSLWAHLAAPQQQIQGLPAAFTDVNVAGQCQLHHLPQKQQVDPVVIDQHNHQGFLRDALFAVDAPAETRGARGTGFRLNCAQPPANGCEVEVKFKPSCRLTGAASKETSCNGLRSRGKGCQAARSLCRWWQWSSSISGHGRSNPPAAATAIRPGGGLTGSGVRVGCGKTGGSFAVHPGRLSRSGRGTLGHADVELRDTGNVSGTLSSAGSIHGQRV
eukprot:RCo054417